MRYTINETALKNTTIGVIIFSIPIWYSILKLKQNYFPLTSINYTCPSNSKVTMFLVTSNLKMSLMNIEWIYVIIAIYEDLWVYYRLLLLP